jgi:two-component system, NarL family, nitrate/nitrite response regulator NarL
VGDRAVTRVLIVARVRLHRDGLASLLGRDRRLEVVGTATGPNVALAKIASVEPDVVVVDAALPGSLETVQVISAARPDVRVVVTAVEEQEAEVIACAEAGAAGYATLDASAAELVDVIEGAADDRIPCSPQMAAVLFRRIGALAAKLVPEPALGCLTSREHEIGLLIEEGLSNKQIAERLQIEVPTVKNHVHHILEKLGVTARSEAAARLRAEAGAHNGSALSSATIVSASSLSATRRNP